MARGIAVGVRLLAEALKRGNVKASQRLLDWAERHKHDGGQHER